MSDASRIDGVAGRWRLAARPRAWALMLAAALLLALLPGCERADDAPLAPSGRPESLVIALTPYAGAAPAFVALAEGFFEREGLTVTVQRHPSGKAALDAVLEGKADLATVAELPVALAAVRGHPVTILATLSTQSDHAIVGRTDLGVGSPESLKGRRIGVSAGTSGDFMLDVMLVRQRLARADVRVVDRKPQELAGALASGEVDAIATWEPYIDDARRQLGDRAAVFPSDGVYDSSFNLAALRRFALQRAETARRVLAALQRAEQLLARDPAACEPIVARSLGKAPGETRQLLARSRFALTLEQHLLVVLEDEGRWALKNRVATAAQAPNFLDAVYLDGLAAVRPRAVTIIR